MRKICLLSLLLALSSSFCVNAQFGITVNGVYFSNGSTVEITCNSGPLQFLVSGYDATVNSNNYSFTYPPGWQVTASPNDYNRTLQPDAATGGSISFNRLLLWKNGSLYDVTVYLNIVRNTPTNLSVTGDGLICDGQTKTYNLSGSQPGDQISWSTNLSGSSSSSSLQTTIGNASGSSYVTANVNTATGCGTFSSTTTVWAGVPTILEMKLDGTTIQTYSPYNLCLYNWYNMYPTHSPSVSSAQWSITSNSSGASIQSSSLNQATISAGSYQGNFVVKVTPTNACGSVDRYYIFNANPCGYFAYTVLPNPAKDEFSVDFESDVEGKNIPEQFDLIPESTYGNSKSVRSFDMRGETAITQAKSSRKLTFNVQDLPRGRYILRIMKEKEDKVETHRILLQ